jgi:hypothetical protein
MEPTTNLDLSRLYREDERLLAKWDAQVYMGEFCKTHHGFVRIAPGLAVTWFRLRRWIRHQWESPLVYAIRSEGRGIVPRIRFQSSSSVYDDMYGALHYHIDANGLCHLDTRSHIRIRDMQVLSANQPWFGVAEEWVFLQAWEAGANWAENNSNNLCKALPESKETSNG